MISSPRMRGNSPSSGWAATAAEPSTACWPGLPGVWARPGEAAERAHTGLALETRVGSRIWINRTTDLISRINTAP